MKSLLLIFLILTSCESKKKNMGNDIDFLQVDFQNLFEKDVTSFFINDCLIFRNKILETDKIDGMTDVSLVFKKDSKNFVTTENYNLNECEVHSNLSLKVVLNETVSVFEIDLKKGKYIGFDKGLNDKVKLNQSKEPFEYD